MIAKLLVKLFNNKMPRVIFAEDKDILLAGGACATVFDNLDTFTKQQRRFRNVSLNEQIIVVHFLIKRRLSKQELRAVILHEEGHIVLGHLNKLIASRIVGVVDDSQLEEEADLYASKRINVQFLISALRKIYKIVETEEDINTSDRYKYLQNLTYIRRN